jgi:hypothetical protein
MASYDSPTDTSSKNASSPTRQSESLMSPPRDEHTEEVPKSSLPETVAVTVPEAEALSEPKVIGSENESRMDKMGDVANKVKAKIPKSVSERMSTIKMLAGRGKNKH